MPLTLTWDGPVATLTVDRPERRNALNMDLWLALRDAARSIADSGNARAVIVTGAGGHFCSGMDLSPTNPAIERILPSISEGIEGPALSLIQELKECVQALADLPCPTIAAIEGAQDGVRSDFTSGLGFVSGVYCICRFYRYSPVMATCRPELKVQLCSAKSQNMGSAGE
jgi:2-(1,2-epoxy-1,2-dihydrophenyl)acetyl-CoA isomerase